jgi:D-tyrosyl-tRNA(Tyr) deacylase
MGIIFRLPGTEVFLFFFESEAKSVRAVIQRVSRAQVRVEGKTVGEIGTGLLVFLGVGQGDQNSDADALLEKIIHLRIFEDEGGKMNRSLIDQGAGLLVVSQFTLYADCRKGRRPSFTGAGEPAAAKALYEYFVARAASRAVKVASGVFQAHMDVELVNAGPVTILLDSQNL